MDSTVECVQSLAASILRDSGPLLFATGSLERCRGWQSPSGIPALSLVSFYLGWYFPTSTVWHQHLPPHPAQDVKQESSAAETGLGGGEGSRMREDVAWSWVSGGGVGRWGEQSTACLWPSLRAPRSKNRNTDVQIFTYFSIFSKLLNISQGDNNVLINVLFKHNTYTEKWQIISARIKI